MDTVLKIVQEQTVLTFFWRSSVHSAKFRQMHAVVTIMAAGNRVSQFPEGVRRLFLANNR